jgi:hypothetical protein
MKRIKLGAAIFSMLVMCSAAAHAQVFAGNALYKAESKAAGKTDKQSQKMDEALEKLRSSMSKGGTEGVSGAGGSLFTALGDFGRPAGGDTSAVRSEPQTRSRPKAVLANYKPAPCWEVCVSWGPYNVCYTWEKRCQ